ncbi:glycosyltransferase [Opitutales bacterium]|nr:glycosyltransferase [Opitutales bacterium]
MLNLIPPIPKEYIIKLLPDLVDQSKIIGELIELEASAKLTHARKRFFRLRLEGSPDLHLSYGVGLKDTYERSKAFNSALPQYTCKPVFIVEDGERHLFGQEFFDGQPIDQSLEYGKRTEEEITSVLQKLYDVLDSLKQTSTKKALVYELEENLRTFLLNEYLTDIDKYIISNYLYPSIIKELGKLKPSLRYSSGDLAARNVLLKGKNNFKIIDCEFTKLTHFHKEDIIRIATFSLNSFKKLNIIQEKLKGVPNAMYAFFWLRQCYLESKVNSQKEYLTHAHENFKCIDSELYFKNRNNVNKSSIFDGIGLELETIRRNYKSQIDKNDLIKYELNKKIKIINEKSREIELIQKQNDEIVKDLNEKTGEIELIQRQNDEIVKDLDEKTGEIELIQKQNDEIVKDLKVATNFSNSLRSELSDKDLLLQKRIIEIEEGEKKTENLNIEITRINKNLDNIKEELALNYDKIRRIECSFSWKVTKPLRNVHNLLKFKKKSIKTNEFSFHIESPKEIPFISQGILQFKGWALDSDGNPPRRIYAQVGKSNTNFTINIERNDLLTAFPHLKAPCNNGFSGKIRTKKGVKFLKIIAIWNDGSKHTFYKKIFINNINLKIGFKNKIINFIRCKKLKILYKGARSADSFSNINVYIIIPVYENLELTVNCIKSVLKTKEFNKSRFKILIICDNSPNIGIRNFLKQISCNDLVKVITNTNNIGFVESINKGLLYSKSFDVILLNSDTIVHDNWVDRILNTFSNSPNIGTITPLSNNATICSFPNFPNGSNLPSGLSSSLIDQICKEYNKGKTYDIPTGVGYCMFISRKAIKAVGLLDSELFNRGYGEENDFCLRATKQGFRNALLTDTFIYHFGGASFGDEKQLLCKIALSNLQRFYPNYQKSVSNFIFNDPIKFDRLTIYKAVLKKLNKPIVICISNNRGGGTLKYVKDKSISLKEEQSRILISNSSQDSKKFNVSLLPEFYNLADNLDEADVQKLFNGINISFIEIHQILDLPYSFIVFIQKFNINYIVYIHDFYLKCPQITLTDSSGKYCGEPPQNICQVCIETRPIPGIISIRKWVNKNLNLLYGATDVITPSVSTKLHMLKTYPSINFKVKPHEQLDYAKKIKQPISSSIYKIGIIGALSKEKGFDLLEDMINFSDRMALPYEFILFGTSYRKPVLENNSLFTCTGQYDENDLERLFEIHKPDIFWFPACWPETYSYTFSHVIKHGYPVVYPDLGAFQERLKPSKYTVVIKWDSSVEKIHESFMKIIANA